jgi:hypothetical protein
VVLCLPRLAFGSTPVICLDTVHPPCSCSVLLKVVASGAYEAYQQQVSCLCEMIVSRISATVLLRRHIQPADSLNNQPNLKQSACIHYWHVT